MYPPHDMGTMADNNGVAIRTRHHCTMPLMAFYNVPATSRASIAIYNNKDDVDQLLESIEKAQNLFKRNNMLEDLYQELIIDHGTNPRNLREIHDAHEVKGNNPLCGDKIHVYVKMQGDTHRYSF